MGYKLIATHKKVLLSKSEKQDKNIKILYIEILQILRLNQITQNK